MNQSTLSPPVTRSLSIALGKASDNIFVVSRTRHARNYICLLLLLRDIKVIFTFSLPRKLWAYQYESNDHRLIVTAPINSRNIVA